MSEQPVDSTVNTTVAEGEAVVICQKCARKKDKQKQMLNRLKWFFISLMSACLMIGSVSYVCQKLISSSNDGFKWAGSAIAFTFGFGLLLGLFVAPAMLDD